MSRPLSFEFLRDTPNFRLFSAERRDEASVNLWLPHHAITNIDRFAGYLSYGDVRGIGVFPDAHKIHTDLPDPPKEVLYRKVIGPDNRIQFHAVPPEPRKDYVMRGTETGRFSSRGPFAVYEESPSLGIGYDIHREMAKQLRHASLYGANTSGGPIFDKYSAVSKADFNELKQRVLKVENRSYVSKPDFNVIQERVFKLELRQNLLFRAVEKLIKIIGWVRRK